MKPPFVAKLRILVVIIVSELLTFDFGLVETKDCIRTKLGRPCKQDEDCHTENELHLYCNKTKKVNVCGFHLETYIGHAAIDIDCEGSEFSAEPWSNPIPNGLISLGMDCMRMCLHVQTCFGISAFNRKCYLKNDKCFANLKKRPGASIGVLNVVREDYRCGCHYPFTRTTSDGQILTWSPDCPEGHLQRNPNRCCSERGLCLPCHSNTSLLNAAANSAGLGTFRIK